MKPDLTDLHGLIIGLGSIGNRHLNNLIELGVETLTVVRRDGSSNRQFQAPGHVSTCHSLSDALQRKPDFAIVCNPTHLHAATAMACLDSGLHVLIEKPLGRQLSDIEQRLIHTAKASDTICAMAYCMRYHPAYQIAFDRVQAGEIGRCLYAKAWFEGFLPDWHPWEDYKRSYAGLVEQGGGVLRTLDHELDFLNWVLGPAHVATGLATNTEGIGIEADDLAIYSLQHPAGVVSQITTSFCRKPQSRGFEFIGSLGSLSYRMETGLVEQYLHAEKTTTRLLDLTTHNINQMYLDLVQDFLFATQKIKASGKMALLSDGVRSLQLIEMI